MDISQDRVSVHIETAPGIFLQATLTINNSSMPDTEPTLAQLRPVVRAMKEMLVAVVPGSTPVARRVRQPPPVEESV